MDYFFFIKKTLNLRFESCKVYAKCLVVKSQLCKKKGMEPKCGFGGNVGILLDCPERLKGIINAPLQIPPFFLVSKFLAALKSGSAQACIIACMHVFVHASSCMVLRPFCSLLLVHSAGAQSVAAAWREFLVWYCEDCCYSGGTELGRFGKGKKCSGCVFVGWGVEKQEMRNERKTLIQ